MKDFEERAEYATELVNSQRGDYIIAKALYLAYQWLDSEEDDSKRQPSDLLSLIHI